MAATAKQDPKIEAATPEVTGEDAAAEETHVENSLGESDAEEIDAAAADEGDEDDEDDETAEDDEEGGCSNAGAPQANGPNGRGGIICVAACCRCYSLPHWPFPASSAGRCGKSIRSSWRPAGPASGP